MAGKEMLTSPEIFDPKQAAATFPGQGAQYPGMGKDFYEGSTAARRTFEEANEALGLKFSEIIFEGSERDLTLTYNAQLGIFITSVAVARTFEEKTGIKISSCLETAGHSLGEYTALVVASVVKLSTAVPIVYQRGKAMFEASRKQDGCMTAILGQNIPQLEIEKICQEEGVGIANVNCPGQIIISGRRESVNNATKRLSVEGAKILPLKVSGAFHSPLMEQAANEMKAIFEKTKFNNPEIPIRSNVTKESLTKAEQFPHELWKQITSCVQWDGSVRNMVNNGARILLELGPGAVLSGLAKRIDNGVKAINLGTLSAIENFARQI